MSLSFEFIRGRQLSRRIRSTTLLIRALDNPLAVYVAVHVNHPEEITEPVVAALRRMSNGGIVLLSQTVLLKGVNDTAAVLEALFRRLVRLKVRPYYLHHPDLAPGTSHFRVPIEVGQALMRELRGRLSGLCQPTYVLDIPGGYGKVPVGPGYLVRHPVSGAREILDYCGERHGYPE
jgi:lysine 2,3-aminomutase